MKIINVCKKCGTYCVEVNQDIVELYTYDNKKICDIAVNGGDIELIKNAHCPRCENWEDGNGNII